MYARITRNKISPEENIRDDYFDARKKETKLNKARERKREKERKERKKVGSKVSERNPYAKRSLTG